MSSSSAERVSTTTDDCSYRACRDHNVLHPWGLATPSPGLTWVHQLLPSQERSTGTVWWSVLAMLVTGSSRPPVYVHGQKRDSCAGQLFRVCWTSSLSTLAHVTKCGKLRRTYDTWDMNSGNFANMILLRIFWNKKSKITTLLLDKEMIRICRVSRKVSSLR